MSRPKDSVIESCLRKVVRAAVSKDEEITVKQARRYVEQELRLEAGFFLSSDEWKQRSKSVIHDAFNEDASEAKESAPKVNVWAKSPVHGKPVAKSKPSSSVPKTQTSKAATKEGTKTKLSNEHVAEEDSSYEESDRLQEKSSTVVAQKKSAHPKQVNGVKRKASEQSTSDDSSSSESSSNSEDNDYAEASQNKKARKEQSSSSGEESKNRSEGESEDDSESQRNSDSSEDATKSAVTWIPAIPPKQFVPPPGFTSLDTGSLGVDKALSVSNIEGKRLWHITAPSNLPLSSITEVSLNALQSNQPLFTRDGIEYITNEHSESNPEVPSLLLATENGYQLLEQGIERSLSIQQKISLPNLSIRQADQNAGSSAAAVVGASQISHAKPQPKGLRMRYKPPGSSPGRLNTLGANFDTDEDAQTAVDVRESTDLTQKVDAMVVDDDRSQKPSKASKKKRKSTEDDASDQPTINGTSRPTSSSEKFATSARPMMGNGTSQEALSKEERKRRKRERKEAKQKAKEAVR